MKQQGLKFLSSSRGSSAIILSVMVSGAVLATIFYNQQSMQWALSSQASAKEEWSQDFIKKYGVTLGSYLVANNLILCREDGWDDDDPTAPLCQWNNLTDNENADADAEENQDQTELEPSHFALDQGGTKTVAGQTRKVLKFKASMQEETINLGKEVAFDLTFDLVNWKNSAIKGLIGEIPDYVCRDTNTSRLRDGYCNGKKVTQKKCKQSADPGAEDIADSRCEFISQVDQDHYIVLVSVQLEGQEELAYAGIRRPLARFTIKMDRWPRCSLSCPSSATPNDNPGCRGDFQPVPNRSRIPFDINVKNEGPGTLYRLSLLRKDTYLKRDGSLSGASKLTITEDILASKKALLPGKTEKFSGTLECRDTVQYSFSQESVTVQGTEPQGGTSVFSRASSNRHTRPFVSLAYSIGSLTSPPTICMKGQEAVSGDTKCNLSTAGEACGGGGTCRQPAMEPRRGLFAGGLPMKVNSTKTETEIVTTTVTTIPGGNGGGGNDGPH